MDFVKMCLRQAGYSEEEIEKFAIGNMTNKELAELILKRARYEA